MSAADLVAAVEALDLGAAYADPFRAAAAAVTKQLDAAGADLCPSAISPAPSDAHAALARIEGRLSKADYGDELARVHGRCLASWPALAELIRQRDVLDDVGRFAGGQSVILARPAHELAKEAIAKFLRAIAEQLAAAEPPAPLAGAARRLLDAEALLGRLQAARGRLEAHAAAELAKAHAEQRAVEQALAEESATAALEAAQEAQRLAGEAGAAKERARRMAGEELARRLRTSRLKELRVGSSLYDVEQTAQVAPGMSAEQIERYSAALAAARAA